MLNRYLRRCIWLLLQLLGLIYRFINIFNRKWKKIALPKITNDLLYLSATKLAENIRQGKISCETVIRAYISRCEEVNPIINAIVETRYEEALVEARKIDEMIASKTINEKQLESLYPLLGVPVSVKESIAVKGMSHQAGMIQTVPQKAKKDAEAVTQLKKAGAIVLLVSNTPELCINMETFNHITGMTKNPYDTRRTAGGSSGGEAALISSAASVIGIGSDIGGSIRAPAMYCGIFGYKPTLSIVSNDGHFPNSDDEHFQNLLCFGPLVRYTEDLPLLINILKSPMATFNKLNEEVSIQNIKFYHKKMSDCGSTTPVSSSNLKAMQKVIEFLKNDWKIQTKEANLQSFEKALEIIFFSFEKINGMDTILSAPNDPKRWRPIWPELLKMIIGQSKHASTSILFCLFKIINKLLPHTLFTNAKKYEEQLKMELSDLLQDNGVILYQILPYSAPFHSQGCISTCLDVCYTAVFNVIGYPSIACPIGLTEEGVPVGIQIIANRGCDNLLFIVSKEIERKFGGWIPPS